MEESLYGPIISFLKENTFIFCLVLAAFIWKHYQATSKQISLKADKEPVDKSLDRLESSLGGKADREVMTQIELRLSSEIKQVSDRHAADLSHLERQVADLRQSMRDVQNASRGRSNDFSDATINISSIGNLAAAKSANSEHLDIRREREENDGQH